MSLEDMHLMYEKASVNGHEDSFIMNDFQGVSF